MKKRIVCIFVLIIIVFLTACTNKESLQEVENEGYHVFTVSDDNFLIKTFINTLEATENDDLTMYSTIEYIGEGDSISIWSGVPYFNYTITDGVEYYYAGVRLDVLKETVLNKGEVVNVSFEKNDLRLPKGKYIFKAYTDFYLDEDLTKAVDLNIEFAVNINTNQEKEVADSTKLAREFLESQGYTIISHEQSVEPYILTKEQLKETYQMNVWMHQSVDPEEFLGKEIRGEIFIIKNHPLDNYKHTGAKSLGKTHIYLIIIDGEVIGGTSFPVMDKQLYGGVFSLEGRTFEEIHPGLDYREWSDSWLMKYRN